jgi:hypothetical protein
MGQQRCARPAGHRQGHQGDAEHARQDNGDAGELRAEQQLADQRRDKQQGLTGGCFTDRSKNK